MLAWSGMWEKPSSSTTGWIVPDHASYAMPWLGRFWYGPVAPYPEIVHITIFGLISFSRS